MGKLTDPQYWTIPVPIVYGPGRLREIARLCESKDICNPLIVTDKGSRDLTFIIAIERYLHEAGIKYDIFSEISPNPRDNEITMGRNLYRRGQHDGVIAIGGGSGMDGGKAICTIANNDLDLWEFEYEKTPPDMRNQRAFPPLICIPTTAGTGAETEGTAIVTDTARLMKFCTWHPDLKPAYALLDPEITIGLPLELTKWTGCDALVHAIEAYCVPSFDPVCDGVALEALKLVSTWLPIVVEQPDNMEARGGMLVGSCLAGISFIKGLGLVHAISHMIGAEFDTHHGLTNAVILPQVLRFNAGAIDNKVPHMTQAMGLEQNTFSAFYDSIVNLLDSLEIPKTLSDIGVPNDCAAAVASKAIQDSSAATNPRVSSTVEIQSIVELALRTGR